MTEPRDQDEAGGQTMPFAAFLQSIRQGDAHHELSAGIQEVAQAVAATGKKGTVTFKLTIGPSKTEAPFEVIDEVRIVPPRLTPKASLFYADDDFNLLRRNPSQLELPGLREVPGGQPVAGKPLKEAKGS